MNYAALNKYDSANGVGIRTSLFVSGCPHKCEGCFNPEAWDYDYGKPFTISIMHEMIDVAINSGRPVAGLSILGGEPFAGKNILGLSLLCSSFNKRKREDQTIWIWSGYTYEEIIKNPIKKILLEQIDVLIDGRFELELKSTDTIFRGSSNQRVIDVQKSLKEGKIIEFDI